MLSTRNEETLLYHPDIQRIREEINSPDYITKAQVVQVVEITDNLSADTWIDMYDILAEINKLIVTVESRYVDQIAGDTDAITFKDYKNALIAETSLNNQWIIDTYEAYQMDYKGRIDIEVYPLLLELKAEWENNISFFKTSCLKQIERDIPDNFDPQSSFFQSYKEKEVASVKNLYAKYKEQDTFEAKLRNRQSIDKDSYVKVLLEAKNMQDRIDTKVEAVKNMNAKILVSKSIVERLKYIVNTISVGTEAKTMALDALSKMQFSNYEYNLIALNCKLTVDGMIKDLRKTEEERKSTASQVIREKIHSDLTYATHIHNEATKPLARTIQNLNDMPLSAGPLMNIITEGIQRSSDVYTLALNSSYILDENDKNLLGKKLDILMRKHEARYYYRSIDQIVSHIEQKGGFPSSVELESILNNVL